MIDATVDGYYAKLEYKAKSSTSLLLSNFLSKFSFPKGVKTEANTITESHKWYMLDQATLGRAGVRIVYLVVSRFSA
jgi:hypothetical protein